MSSSRRVPPIPRHRARPLALRGAPRQSIAGLGLVAALLVLVIIGFLVHTFFFTVYRVRQDGMFPTVPAGTIFFGQRKPYAAQIQRGDLIVFEHTHRGQDNRFVWRVIALPGDTVAMEGTAVWVGKERLPHDVVEETNDSIILRETNGDRTYNVAYDRHSSHPALPLHVKVAADHFFVLGDNRHDALDSTYLGGIPFEEIVAKKF